MDSDAEERNRKVIPRWRDFNTTVGLGELKSLTRPEEPTDASIAEQLEDWGNNKSLAFATDLVGAGLVVGKTEGINEAAEFVLSQSDSTEIQKRVALQVLDPSSCSSSMLPEIAATSGDELISRSRILVKKYRKQLQEGIRNPIKLVDLAREYATLGSLEKARRAMDVAVTLAPANRFVVRSAARLFVHAGEIDRAHYLLKRAPNIKSDPWLLAAEIAVASLKDRTSNNVRTGLTLIKDENHNSFDLSELTSAIATLEMENAKSKNARKLFRQALRTPTENSIAQAEWASRAIAGLSVEVGSFNVPRKYEATARSSFLQNQFESALEQGKNWIRDQPFAVSPVIFTSMVATVLENFELGEVIVRFGLRANPENVFLRNNLAFALASNNQPFLAESELRRIDRASLSTEEQIVVTATDGLIKFRKGLHEEGRLLYRQAIELAQANNELSYVIRALIFLAREEIYAQTLHGVTTLESAEREARHSRLNLDLKVLLDRLTSMVTSEHQIASTSNSHGSSGKAHI